MPPSCSHRLGHGLQHLPCRVSERMMGLEPTTFCMANARDVRTRSCPFAETTCLQRLPVRPANGSEPERTSSAAIAAIVIVATPVIEGARARLNASGAALPPKRPQPLCLTPPKGVDGSIEVGYWLFPHARGRGLATRAVRAVAREAFASGLWRGRGPTCGLGTRSRSASSNVSGSRVRASNVASSVTAATVSRQRSSYGSQTSEDASSLAHRQGLSQPRP
jgi:hypothetical protein